MVLYDTGCRISEAPALTSKSIDMSVRAEMFECLKKQHCGSDHNAPLPVTRGEARNVMPSLEAAIRSATERRTVAVI